MLFFQWLPSPILLADVAAISIVIVVVVEAVVAGIEVTSLSESVALATPVISASTSPL
jgi:hypothetical protein